MKISIPVGLTFNGGFVETAGFLALHCLFTAHIRRLDRFAIVRWA